MDVNELGQMTPEEAMEHWYFRAKFRMLEQTLKGAIHLSKSPTIADFGCGLGIFLSYLQRSSFIDSGDLFGIDNAFEKTTTALGSSVPIHPAFPDGKPCHLVLMMDVLEHIEDDEEILKFVTDHLLPGGYGYISVPAFQWLWSSHDVFLHHKRRYTRQSLLKLISKISGLNIIRCHYYYASILPIAATVRLLKSGQKDSNSSDLKPVPMPLNRLLRLALAAESRIAPYNTLGGLSVVGVFQKAL